MKKTLIILTLLLASIWLVAMPALVGSYLDRVAPSWLEESGMEDTARFDAGWFTSSLEINSGYRMNLRARHVPPSSLAWLRFSGELQAPVSPEPFRIGGEFGLTGLSSVDVRAPELAIDGQVRLNSGPTRLALNQSLDQASTLTVRIDDLALSDQLGNAIFAPGANLTLGWQALGSESGPAEVEPDGEDRLALSLTLDLVAAAAPASILRLALDASPVERNALADLIQGLQQLSQTQGQSTARQFALLTVAGAWQQLSQHGLTVRLERLQIGSENQFSGHWSSLDGPPVIRGDGSLESLSRALQPLVGLSARVSAETAARSIRTWLDELRQRGWLIVEGDRFEFEYFDRES